MKKKFYKSRITINEGFEGKSIEREVEEIVANKQPIEATSPIIFTEREDGVLPQTDIRTDRFELAMDAVDKAVKSQRSKRDEVLKAKLEANSQEGVVTE